MMSKCELQINNEKYEMLKSATYTDDGGNSFDLGWYCNVGNYQDSVIVGKSDELVEETNDYVRYYPHGYHNQEGNRIEFYSINVDELNVINDTGEVLIVNEDYVEPGAVWIYDKNQKKKTPRENLSYSLQDFKNNNKRCLICGSPKTYGTIGLIQKTLALDIVHYKCSECGKRYYFTEDEDNNE